MPFVSVKESGKFEENKNLQQLKYSIQQILYTP